MDNVGSCCIDFVEGAPFSSPPPVQLHVCPNAWRAEMIKPARWVFVCGLHLHPSVEAVDSKASSLTHSCSRFLVVLKLTCVVRGCLSIFLQPIFGIFLYMIVFWTPNSDRPRIDPKSPPETHHTHKRREVTKTNTRPPLPPPQLVELYRSQGGVRRRSAAQQLQ